VIYHSKHALPFPGRITFPLIFAWKIFSDGRRLDDSIRTALSSAGLRMNMNVFAPITSIYLTQWETSFLSRKKKVVCSSQILPKLCSGLRSVDCCTHIMHCCSRYSTSVVFLWNVVRSNVFRKLSICQIISKRQQRCVKRSHTTQLKIWRSVDVDGLIPVKPKQKSAVYSLPFYSSENMIWAVKSENLICQANSSFNQLLLGW